MENTYGKGWKEKVNNVRNRPLISVVVPVYNTEQYFERCIESILNQSYKNLEVIIVNDGSPGNIRELMQQYKEDKRVYFVDNKENRGLLRARVCGAEKAKGKYIAFLDADDWWEEGKLEAQVETMELTGCDICSTGRELMQPDGHTTGKYIPVKERITYHDLLKHNSINCSSVLLRREDALAFPMEHDDSHEDYITWLKVVRKYGHATGIDEPYLKYRLSQGGKSRNKIKSAAMTYQVYRYVGYGPVKSACFFVSYALHGIWKYR